jgi:DNA-binding NtrC family response regulator
MTAALGTSLVGDSPPMRALRRLIASVAKTRLPVVIYGETGTGKELVAAELHAQSGRRGPFVPVNVCAIGDTMFDDALFGHVRGSFTGAVRDAPGFLREADQGTLFLDEISGLAVSLQAKLLRAVETGVFRPLGATRDARSDFRVLAATNERLDDLVQAGRFRSDLMHRLGGVAVTVPSLGDRRQDIPLLVDHFLRQVAGPREIRATVGATTRLLSTEWPGNVRELRQVVETATAFAGDALDEEAVDRALTYRTTLSGALPTDNAERVLLGGMLEDYDWNVDQVADALGLHRATVYRRMKRCGLTEHGEEAVRRIVAPSRATSGGERDWQISTGAVSD